MKLLWAAKGGSGTTVTACSLAVASRPPIVLVDLAGDVPATLGIEEPATPGVADWLASPTAGVAQMQSLLVCARDGLFVLALGAAPLPARTYGEVGHARSPDAWTRLGDALVALSQSIGAEVLIDCGLGMPPDGLRRAGTTSIIVTRECYVALRRGVRMSHAADAAIVVHEPGRPLRTSDVISSLGVPVTATIPVDPAVSRAVDSGLLRLRIPRSHAAALRPLAAVAA
jgi:hypothetical protein